MCYGFSSLRVFCHLKCSQAILQVFEISKILTTENMIFLTESVTLPVMWLLHAKYCKSFNTEACVVTDHHLLVVARTDWKNQRYGKDLKAHVWVFKQNCSLQQTKAYLTESFADSEYFLKNFFHFLLPVGSNTNHRNFFSVYSQLSDRNSLVDLIQTFWWQDWLTVGFVESTCDFC